MSFNFKQCELPLVLVTKNPSPKGENKTDRRHSTMAEQTYRTTKQVVELLGLESDYLLRKARSNGSAYRSNRHIAVPAGHNKWEVFRRCK